MNGYINKHENYICGCRKNNPESQLMIYKLYYKSMYNVCLRIVNNSYDAEDIMQESFLDAFTKINTYNYQASFGSWLKRIVINNSLDYLKKKKYSSISIDENIITTETIIDPFESDILFNSFNINDIMPIIKDSLNYFSDNYRVVLVLHLIEGFDHDEISQILGITNNHSRTIYSRAKKQLKSIIQNKIQNLLKESA